MENIIAKIEKNTRKVFLSKSVIGNDGENLQEKLVFSFIDEFVNGTARLELNKNNTQSYIMLTKVDNTYELPIRSLITKVGKLDLQLVITEGTNENEIPVFKSNVFFVIVNPSINAQIEEEPTYPQWVDVANEKLNELDSAIEEASNLNIEVSKSGTTTTVTLTDKDGETSSVSILDGAKGDKGDKGDKGEQGIQGERGEKGDKGDKGDTGEQGIQGERGLQGEQGIPGTNGRDGYIQYTAGDNITIENNVISASGGGTSDYDDLSNKPQINGVTLSGNKSASDLNIGGGVDYKISPTNFNFNNFETGTYYFNVQSYSFQITYGSGSKFISNFCPMCINYFKNVNSVEKPATTETVVAYVWGYVRQTSLNDGTGNLILYKIAFAANSSDLTYTVEKKYTTRILDDDMQQYIKTRLSIYRPLILLTEPTANNHATTKKYVDDSIAAAITTTLGGSY